MPELPEVETTLRGIAPHITGKTIHRVHIRQPKLRWLVPENLSETLCHQVILSCSRRAKYLILQFEHGIVLIHLGMSGSLRIFTPDNVPLAGKHDHIDFECADGTVLRYHDPRRFGAVLWYAGAAEHHHLLQSLAPEPLSDEFNIAYLTPLLNARRQPIKTVLMDNKIVVGVGNIYANESLFLSGITPQRPANQLNATEIAQLIHNIKQVLQRAIECGGSTLRDFVDSNGKSGYFQQEYRVYGRHNQPCLQCGMPIHKIVIAQRASFYCANCQK